MACGICFLDQQLNPGPCMGAQDLSHWTRKSPDSLVLFSVVLYGTFRRIPHHPPHPPHTPTITEDLSTAIPFVRSNAALLTVLTISLSVLGQLEVYLCAQLLGSVSRSMPAPALPLLPMPSQSEIASLAH